MLKALLIALTLSACAATDTATDADAETDSKNHFMFILRKEGDEYALDKFDGDRQRLIPAGRFDKRPASRLISTFPADYRMTFAWEENYPRFDGVNYKMFDEYATTIQNAKYAFVFRQGLEIPDMFGELYFVNKEKKSTHMIKNATYDFQIAGHFMFYLRPESPQKELTIYDLDTFETVGKVLDVIEIGFQPRQQTQ